MWCSKCKTELDKCMCEDIEERLEQSGATYKSCKKCKKHYQRCKCDQPEWTVKGMGPMNN